MKNDDDKDCYPINDDDKDCYLINDDDKGGYMSCYESMHEAANSYKNDWLVVLFLVIVICFSIVSV
jgi:hypothetical protein